MSHVVKEFSFEFNEYEDPTKKVSGKIRIGDDGLAVYIDGYGECTSNPGESSIVILEKHQGQLRLLAWDDIQQHDPTVVELEGASESRRLPDDLEVL